MADPLKEQLIKHLTDVHSIEEQALQQMRVAPRLARDPELARAFREHIAQTENQERLVRGRLEAQEADPSRVKDLLARAGGVGMVLFARSQPDTPGKLVSHAYSYEHMELAAYELLSIVAERAGDAETVAVSRGIREQEAVRARLDSRGERPSRFKNVLLRVGGLNLGAFFGAQPDTPAKLAGFAFAFEHLEIAAYEQLLRVARRAGDEETARVAERIVGEERAAAAAIRFRFEPAMDATLRTLGIGAAS